MSGNGYVAAGTLFESNIPRDPFGLAKPIPLLLDELYDLLVYKIITRKLTKADEGKSTLSTRFITNLLIRNDEEVVGLTSTPDKRAFYVEDNSHLWEVSKYEGN